MNPKSLNLSLFLFDGHVDELFRAQISLFLLYLLFLVLKQQYSII